MVAIFAMISFVPALGNSFPDNNQIQLQDLSIICIHYSGLIIKTKNIPLNFFSKVNSIDIRYFNVIRIYYYSMQHDTTQNLSGNVTLNSYTIIIHNFNYIMANSNSILAFKEYNGYMVIKNICFSLINSSHDYIAMNVNSEIYNNCNVFMHIIYSMKLHENYITFMNITNLVKHVGV